MARIVVADDDSDIRDLVVFKLRQAGHDVEAVDTGAAAVDACRRDVPALVVLDLMMPGMSGLEAARLLRADETTQALPIVMLTARAQESDIEQGFAAGAHHNNVNPVSPRELAGRVEAILTRAAG